MCLLQRHSSKRHAVLSVRCFPDDDCLISTLCPAVGVLKSSCICLKTNELCSSANMLKAHGLVTDMKARHLWLAVLYISFLRLFLLAHESTLAEAWLQKQVSRYDCNACNLTQSPWTNSSHQITPSFPFFCFLPWDCSAGFIEWTVRNHK
jgi:hypothetical protein